MHVALRRRFMLREKERERERERSIRTMQFDESGYTRRGKKILCSFSRCFSRLLRMTLWKNATSVGNVSLFFYRNAIFRLFRLVVSVRTSIASFSFRKVGESFLFLGESFSTSAHLSAMAFIANVTCI